MFLTADKAQQNYNTQLLDRRPSCVAIIILILAFARTLGALLTANKQVNTRSQTARRDSESGASRRWPRAPLENAVSGRLSSIGGNLLPVSANAQISQLGLRTVRSKQTTVCTANCQNQQSPKLLAIYINHWPGSCSILSARSMSLTLSVRPVCL